MVGQTVRVNPFQAYGEPSGPATAVSRRGASLLVPGGTEVNAGPEGRLC
jgi:hypothetical protein